jgi:3-oxoacyl-[acyl-carrier-protein] synthase II
MPPRVFITGAGIISATGNGTGENLSSLYALNTGIGRLSLFASVHSDIPVAEVKQSNEELADIAGVDFKEGKYSRNALLALIAAQQAFTDAGSPDLSDRCSGVIFATTTGGMDLNERYYKSLLREDTFKEYIPVFDSADCTEKIANRFGIRHNITTISTACSSSANAIMHGARLIRNNQTNRVLVGGADAITKFTLNGFIALEILSPTGCRPFDQYRNGLTIGEGAAVLMLESEDIADPGRIICEITGYANVNEAYHQTASSADGVGAMMAMQKALDVAGLKHTDIGYINAHGTGTEINDLSEGRAIENVFREKIPPVSSTKAFTGHTLGASGAIEAVFSALSVRHQIILPGINCMNPMPELSFQPPAAVQKAVVNHVISNSFGFGGNNTSLIFSRV